MCVLRRVLSAIRGFLHDCSYGNDLVVRLHDVAFWHLSHPCRQDLGFYIRQTDRDIPRLVAHDVPTMRSVARSPTPANE